MRRLVVCLHTEVFIPSLPNVLSQISPVIILMTHFRTIYCIVLCWRRVNISNDVISTDNFCQNLYTYPLLACQTLPHNSSLPFHYPNIICSRHYHEARYHSVPLSSFYYFPMPLLPKAVMVSPFLRFLYHTQKTTHDSQQDFSGRVISSSQRTLPANTQGSQQISTTPVGFKPTICEGQQPQTKALVRTATGIGSSVYTPQFTSKHSLCYIF